MDSDDSSSRYRFSLEGMESMEAPSSSPPLFIYLESQSFPEKLNHGGKEAHLALPIPPVISLATSGTPPLLIPLHRNRACIHNDVNRHRHLLEPGPPIHVLLSQPIRRMKSVPTEPSSPPYSNLSPGPEPIRVCFQ